MVSNQPTSPSPGRYDGGFIHNLGDWSRAPATSGSAGQRLWAANIEVNPVDNTTFLVNVTPWQGPVGPMGAQGTPGTNGTNGAVGPAGPIGPMGPAGTNGTNGINGTNGENGTCLLYTSPSPRD